MKILKKIKNSLKVILVIIIILLIVLLFLLPGKNNNKLIGTWTTDNVTIYKFNKDNTGVLILPLNNYEFTYEIKDNHLSIDFKSEKSEDSKYTYRFKDDELILEGDNGKFTFKKMKEDKSKD